MDSEFTPALQFAWNRAARLAVGELRAEIEPHHLLRGLLAEEEGHAASMLTTAGLDLIAWRRLYPDDPNLASEAPDSPPAIAPLLRLVIAKARKESSRLTEEGSLATDQVVAALVSMASGASRALESCGFDSARFASTAPAELPPVQLESPLDLSEPPDTAGVLRIVDAAANRAREGLRVIEDHCRFALDDAVLSRSCKELRHGLAEALTELPAAPLLAARDTIGDVGVDIATEADHHRADAGHVLAANAKRLQESLRSLEEYGKILSPEFARRVEQLRYRSYTLEKTLLLRRSMPRLANARLYALLGEDACRSSIQGTLRELAEGGVDIMQLREKKRNDRDLLTLARDLRRLTRSLGVLFIVNDRPDVALLAEADGVHLGQDDMPIREARKIVGADAIIGVSTHDLDQVRQAVLDGADYLGVGPAFPSRTKQFAEFAGLDFVRQSCAETSLPIFAIGGIDLDNLGLVLEAGASRVAASHALCAADDPKREAAKFLARLLG